MPCPAPSTVCNSGFGVGEVGVRFRAKASIAAGEEGTKGRCQGEAESRAQISMSVILKPSTMLSMLRMKVSSFE